MFLFHGKRISQIPKRSEIERLTIDELIQLSKNRRSIKHSFKKLLVDYILSLGEFK